MSLISLNDIKLSFGGPLIFDDLNLQIEQGERVALIGRNGVGKTSLMRVITFNGEETNTDWLQETCMSSTEGRSLNDSFSMDILSIEIFKHK